MHSYRISVSNLILNLLRKLTHGMHYSFGAKDGSENSRIVFPLWTFVDRLVITKHDEQPPELGNIIYEPKESVSKRKVSDATGNWELGKIYTLSFNSSNIDLPTWTLVNLPFIPNTDLHSFWGDSNLHIVVYDVPNQKKITRHSKDIVKYALNIQVRDTYFISHFMSISKTYPKLFIFFLKRLHMPKIIQKMMLIYLILILLTMMKLKI